MGPRPIVPGSIAGHRRRLVYFVGDRLLRCAVFPPFFGLPHRPDSRLRRDGRTVCAVDREIAARSPSRLPLIQARPEAVPPRRPDPDATALHDRGGALVPFPLRSRRRERPEVEAHRRLRSSACSTLKTCWTLTSGQSRWTHSSFFRPFSSSTGLPASSRAVRCCRHSTYRIAALNSRIRPVSPTSRATPRPRSASRHMPRPWPSGPVSGARSPHGRESGSVRGRPWTTGDTARGYGGSNAGLTPPARR